jgi:integrase
MGLGTADIVTLAEARAKAVDARRLVAKGIDPIDEKRGVAANVTFAAVAADYIEDLKRVYRSANSVKSVHTLLLTHASDLSPQPVNQIGSGHIINALRPLWLRSPDQARRAVAACLRVLRYAKAKGLSATNVAEMREDLHGSIKQVKGLRKHYKALDYQHVPSFVRELRAAQKQGDAMSPFVIEFILLTAARESEVCGMQWSEINWQDKLWILPAECSKTGREHRVPLCDRALALLMRQRGPNGMGFEPDQDGYVWPGRHGEGAVTGKGVYKYLTETMDMPVTVHGFRSTFRDWAGNETHFDRVTCELALSHRAGDAVELAYRRSDALAKRRALMNEWANYCEGRGAA